jgi:hypothetical protein
MIRIREMLSHNTASINLVMFILAFSSRFARLGVAQQHDRALEMYRETQFGFIAHTHSDTCLRAL